LPRLPESGHRLQRGRGGGGRAGGRTASGRRAKLHWPVASRGESRWVGNGVIAYRGAKETSRVQQQRRAAAAGAAAPWAQVPTAARAVRPRAGLWRQRQRQQSPRPQARACPWRPCRAGGAPAVAVGCGRRLPCFFRRWLSRSRCTPFLEALQDQPPAALLAQGFPAAAPGSAGLCKGSHTLRSVLAATQAFSLSSCVANPAGLRSPAGGARRVSQGRGAAYVHARGLVSGSAGVTRQPFAGLLGRGGGPSNLPPQTFLSTTDAPRAGARPGRSVAVALTALDRATCFSARQTPSLPRQSNLGFRSRFRRSPPPSGRGLPRN
jgi:hypothetical protein